MLQVVGDDRAASELSDQQIARKLAKPGWSHCNAPWRIQQFRLPQFLKQVSTRIEDPYESIARARNVVLFISILLRVRHHNVAVYILNAERRKSARDAVVDERVSAEGVWLE